VGAFATATLQTATAAIESTSAGDATYLQTDAALTALGQERDALAAQMNELINSQFFGSSAALLAPHGIQGSGHDSSVPTLISRAGSLIARA
jgi:hypothetical protein